MNTRFRLATLSRLVLVAGLAVAAHAHAGGVHWAVNVSAPLQGMGYVSTAVSNSRYGVYGPPPVVYAPAPMMYVQPAVVIQPRPVYVPSPVVVYQEPRRCEPRGVWGWGGHRRHHHHDEDRYAWNDDGRDEPRMMMPREGDHGRDGWDRGGYRGR